MALTACSLTAASAPAAQLPAAESIVELPVLKPNDTLWDPYSPGVLIVASVGPPPAIVVVSDLGDDQFVVDRAIPLPADCEPRALYQDDAGFLHIICTNGRTFRLDLGPDNLVETQELPAEVEFPTGASDGFATDALTDFGDGLSAGSLFYGPGFAIRMPFGDTIVPNGIDLLPDVTKTRKGRVSSEFIVIDAQNDDLLEISDELMPVIERNLDGPPGVPTPRDVTVDPLNLRDSFEKRAVHPILVSSPDLGNVFWSAGLGGKWSPISPAPFGRPVKVAASCEHLAVTDFTNNKVTIFDQDPPRKAECEDIVDLIVSAGGGAPFTEDGIASLFVKAYVTGDVRLLMQLDDLIAAEETQKRARPAKAKAKAKLKAGRVARERVKFSRAETRRIAATLARRGVVKGRVTAKLRNAAGERTKRVYRVSLRAG